VQANVILTRMVFLLLVVFHQKQAPCGGTLHRLPQGNAFVNENLLIFQDFLGGSAIDRYNKPYHAFSVGARAGFMVCSWKKRLYLSLYVYNLPITEGEADDE
jgi:hypothetical protein